uniref:Uncharacterized protein n=1 Tax=Tetraselmis sp. GSL018 TaxID=582737 RepID=A0A061SFV0_9CHLO|mmetsp:Transcript_11304/g.26793  ORF Transcript_11304/g.26793 Transcript_11304/m.26793 type:complete len:214 (+) Transcript_11304:481-1122(+)
MEIDLVICLTTSSDKADANFRPARSMLKTTESSVVRAALSVGWHDMRNMICNTNCATSSKIANVESENDSVDAYINAILRPWPLGSHFGLWSSLSLMAELNGWSPRCRCQSGMNSAFSSSSTFVEDSGLSQGRIRRGSMPTLHRRTRRTLTAEFVAHQTHSMMLKGRWGLGRGNMWITLRLSRMRTTTSAAERANVTRELPIRTHRLIVMMLL